MPRNIYDRVMLVHNFLLHELGRIPTHAEIADELGVKEEGIAKVLQRQPIVERDSDLQRLQNRVIAVCAPPVLVYYSAYPLTGSKTPIDNLDEVAVEGKVRLISTNYPIQYTSPEVISPTWLEVAVYANEMLKTVGAVEAHYLEGLEPAHVSDGIPYMFFLMGS